MAATAGPAAEGATFTFNGETLTVLPKCETNSGVWVCTTHGESFPNNMSKDGHIMRAGHHDLAWLCHFHGPEVP